MDTHMTVLEIDPSRQATACIILLHGLGADGHDLAPLAGELEVAGRDRIRFLFPNAPLRPVSLNAGQVMRAWYDIHGLTFDHPEDEPGIQASAAALHGLIEGQIDAGIAPGRIIVGGFSQGGAVALYGALRFAPRLGGVLALSTYLPLHARLLQEPPVADPATPIMMTHGVDDPVVPYGYGRLSQQRLEALGYSVAWKDYPMGHALCDREIGDIGVWLNAILTG